MTIEVGLQLEQAVLESPSPRSRTRHKTLAYGVAGERRDCGAQVSQEQIDKDELYYEVTTDNTFCGIL